jgi:hypothetical protein
MYPVRLQYNAAVAACTVMVVVLYDVTADVRVKVLNTVIKSWVFAPYVLAAGFHAFVNVIGVFDVADVLQTRVCEAVVPVADTT